MARVTVWSNGLPLFMFTRLSPSMESPVQTLHELSLSGLDRQEVSIEKRCKRKIKAKVQTKKKKHKTQPVKEPECDDNCSETLDGGWYSPLLVHLLALRRVDVAVRTLNADPLTLPEPAFSPVTCEEIEQNVVFTIHERPPPTLVKSTAAIFAQKEHAIPNKPGCFLLI